jgi:hypothetical protein
MSNAQALIFVAVVAIAGRAAGRWRERRLPDFAAASPYTKVYAGDQKRLCDRTHV